jgi:UDP-perosamine 4-acetyltransferase
MAIPVIGFGAGGHAKVLIETLRMSGQFDLVGLLDPRTDVKAVLGVQVLGGDVLLEELIAKGIQHFFIGLGTVGKSAPRRRLYELAFSLGMKPVSAIHPQAVISPSAVIGLGVTVLAQAVVNASAVLGSNVLINTGAVVEHDCVIEDHVHIATGARLTGAVRVGIGAHIGAGATVRQGVSVGPEAVVGAGAVVLKDIEAKMTVVGVPARPLDQLRD